MHKDFFNLIKEDHRRINDLLKELADKSDREIASREEIFIRLKQELIPHIEAEDRVFYPALKGARGTKVDILESIEEHHVARIVLDELDKLSRKAPNWLAKLVILKEMIERHMKEEEDEVFDLAEDAITEQQMAVILRRFQEEKEKAMVRVG